MLFSGGVSPNIERVDFTLHQIPHRIIDHTMALNWTFAGKLFGNDMDDEVTAAPGTGMTGVFVTFVDDLQLDGVKAGLKPFTDHRDALAVLTHGRTFLKGLTLTRA